MLLCLECQKRRGRERSPFRQRGVCTDCGKPTSKGFFFASKKEKKKSKWRCPDCGCELTYLCYNQDVVETGTYDLESSYCSSDETSSDNEPTYSCPECGDDVTVDDCLVDNEERPEEAEPVRPSDFS